MGRSHRGRRVVSARRKRGRSAGHAILKLEGRKGDAAPPSRTRRDGRAVEGARLESVYRGNSIEGSNPSLSAIYEPNEQLRFNQLTLWLTAGGGDRDVARFLRPGCRKYPEPFAAFDPVSVEIRVVHRKNGSQALAPRQVHKCRIGEIHGAIPITRHKSLNFR